jgi:hemolysin activation/secretion protein
VLETIGPEEARRRQGGPASPGVRAPAGLGPEQARAFRGRGKRFRANPARGCGSAIPPGFGGFCPGLRHSGRKNGRRRLGILLVLAAAVYSSAAWAVGGYESTDRPSEHGPALPGFAPRQPPQGFTLPPVPENPPAFLGDSRKVYIRRIVVEGNTVIPGERIKALVQPRENREVSVAELEELRQALTKVYVDEGYINSGAIIPQDALKNGELRFVIIEGRLDEVRVQGQERLREGYIKNRLQGDPDRPLNIHDLEDRFQLLLSDPLISRMNGRIVPGASPGHGILDVDVVRARPYRLSLFGDNFRPPSVGAEAFGLTGSVANLTGLGDTLDFTFVTSSGSKRYAGGVTLPLTDYGTLAFFHFDEGDSVVVEAPFQDLDIKSEVHNLEGGISHPLVNTLRQRLNLGVLLAIRENDTSVLGRPFSFVPGVPGGRNQATVWRVFQDYLQRWERHALALRSTFSIGMNGLGATPPNDHYPSSEFFAWLGQAQYAYRVDDAGTQLILRGNAQFADSPLLPLEKIAVGGVSTVRGYRTNTLVRDNGYTLSVELHYPLLDFELWNIPSRVDLIPFMDYGEAWNIRESWNPDDGSDALWAAGVGFNWQFQPVFAEFFYGYAINRPDRPKYQQFDDLQDNGLYFQVRLDVF